jgi:hypothetical protein
MKIVGKSLNFAKNLRFCAKQIERKRGNIRISKQQAARPHQNRIK